MPCVYMHRCRANGKAYVGISSDTMERRWRRHVTLSRMGSELLFHRAIRKHGEDAFEHVLLATCKSFEDAKRLEVLFIKMYETYAAEHPRKGYNMTRGGDGTVGSHTSRPCSEEKKRRISAALKGKKKSEEHRAAMRRADRPRHLSEEHRQALRDAWRRKTELSQSSAYLDQSDSIELSQQERTLT